MLHVLGDLLNSVGVIIAAVIIWFWPEAKIADPLVTFVFTIIIVQPHTLLSRSACLF